MFKDIKNKIGSYIVEAAILLPIFILGIVAIISVLPAMAKAERIVYQVSDEMRLECISSAFVQSEVLLPMKVTTRVESSDVAVRGFFAYSDIFRQSSGHMDEMISLHWRGRVKQPSLTGIFNDIRITGSVVGRAFVGAERSVSPGDRRMFESKQDSVPVFIFPNEGRKFHGRNCRMLTSNVSKAVLTERFKKSHKPCKICKAKSIPMMNNVYVFKSGDSRYHRESCSILKRRFIQMDMSIAVKRGYQRCKICGGV